MIIKLNDLFWYVGLYENNEGWKQFHALDIIWFFIPYLPVWNFDMICQYFLTNAQTFGYV